MNGHSQVVIAAPEGDLLLTPGELLGLGVVGGRAVHLLEHAVGVLELLLADLLMKIGLVTKLLA